mmetsp:Transcript_46643/g.110563  ORF Transcript_46643/g.110563 Transcript_46643/m.110563 type:complete len:255 (+) Transcript_46643:117-881(+)|eukprot:CAMPEP_0177712212 /NCGR_PEP_ID=MMETSP0484_2-20121128/12278_1 /TAXON_ID=354590 /ORGANISM="Rhodomonas lens, Strain RHODO" /LENGTH=254 /DNA_ID=CAMNT_0019224005 /DNA_START=55 /DNA_END=819 /DNA_ORIENTATION=+
MSDKLAAALEAAKITRIVLIRHANAAPPDGSKPKKGEIPIHDWQRDDQMRPLTEKGKQQAAVAREWFQTQIGVPNNKILITSGARRASETLQLLAEQKAKKQGFMAGLLGCGKADTLGMEVAMDVLPSLHPAGIAPACEALFDKNGYAPLQKFYDMEGGEQAFAEYAEIVAGEMVQLAAKVEKAPGSTVSLFGHAVFLNAVAMMLASKAWGASPETLETLKSLDLGEAEGIEVQREGASCVVKHISVRPHALWS